MVWSEVRGLSRELILEFGSTHLAKHHYLNVIPGKRGNLRLGIPQELDRPLYWMLPEEYLGDKTLAYNGYLQFRIASSDNRSTSDEFLHAYPLVLLQGNYRLVLIHTRYLPSQNGYYSVHMHEDEWQLLENPRLPVTREIMMVALQNVQDVLIRASETSDVKIMRLDNVTLDVAVPVSPSLPSPYVAVGIEHCHCPPEYTGSSCQDPGFGYYRKRDPNFKESKNVIDLVGRAEPCPCNNRSKFCDKDTGICYNCTENTEGPYCEVCAKGYFGDPSNAPCMECACPLVTNSFSDTCKEGEEDYVCVNCRIGYTGRHCERCADSYYGNPMEEGGTCIPCNCNPFGSRHQTCNKTTGQCACLRGISGRDCSFCEPRHILTGTGCLSCDTDCIRVLLDDIAFLIDMAEEHNLSQFEPPPWLPLLDINTERMHLEEKVRDYWKWISQGKQLFQNFTSGFDLETHFDLLYLTTRSLIQRAPPTAFSAQETREEAEYVYNELDKLWKEIKGVTDGLLMYGLNQEYQMFKIEDALEEGASILDGLKAYDSAIERETAEREFRKASELLQRVRMMILDYPYLEEVRKRISDIEKFLQTSISRIEKDVRVPAEESLAINSRIRSSMTALQNETERLRSESESVIILLERAESTLEDARNHSNVTLQYLKEFPELAPFLQNYTILLEHDHGIMARLNPEYRKIYVIPAIEHANKLEERAEELFSLFSATSELSRLPLKASNVYREITSALASAEQFAEDALETSKEAYAKVGRKRNGLRKEARNSRRESERIFNTTIALEKEVTELQRSTEEEFKDQKRLWNQISQQIEEVKLLDKRLKGLPRDTEELLSNASKIDFAANKTSINILEKLNKIRFEIEEVTPLVEKLKASSESGLQNLTLLVRQAQEDLAKATMKSKVARELLQKVEKKHSQVHPRLIELKNKVALARQKASTIEISLSVDKSGVCTRSYQPDLEPGTRNNIILNYAISSKAKESLLFFLGSSTNEDFLAIEMIERKVRFLWNSGGGTKVITHNLTIETSEPQLLKAEGWYRIEATRVGNIGELRVQPSTDGAREDPWKVSGASPAGHVKMDLDTSSYLFVGGLPKGHKVPRQLKATSFVGCLYQVILEGKRVGLWNFLTNVGCDGCRKGITDQGDLSAFEFKGNGYAVLPQIRRYRGNTHYITLRFKTLDEDALLFLSPDSLTGNFVSLELRAGHVLYQFDLGNTSRLSLQTVEKYNTGNWTRIVAQRVELQGQLAVEDETQEGTLPLGGPTELHLKDSYMYFGGVPPTFPSKRWQSTTFKSFLGCMKDLQVETTTLNLLKREYYGVEGSCKDKGIHIATFKGKGYIEIPSQPLRQVANFSFTFQSMQENALLILSTFEGFRTEYLRKKNYYSVALKDGRIQARFGGNVKEVEMLTNGTYNDGHYHTVMVLKKHRKIIMKIDDKEVASTRLPVDAQVIDAPESRGLFLGGVREDMLLPIMVKIRDSFIGILKDVILNDVLIDFRHHFYFEGVEIGHERIYDDETQREFPHILPPLERCAEMTSYGIEKHAVRFGDIRHSYAQVPIKKKDFGWDFNITFEFRTYYPNGLLLFLKNGRRKSHLAVMLQRRRIVVDVQDRKHRKLSSQGFLNNGVWHNVTVIKMNRRLNLTVDNREPLNAKVRRKLSLRSPLYIGGVPEKTQLNRTVVKESFKGCIKNLKRNGRLIDTARGKLYGVGFCFSSIELGAYFGGDAYAIYDDEFKLGPIFELQLQFKTTRPNGVFLSLSETAGTPSFLLELNNGKVVATIDAGGNGGKLRAVKEFDKYRMCDGEWHIIIMQYLPQEINLKVDKYDLVYGLAENSAAPQLVTSAPLYIGGIPENGSRQENFVGCIKNVAINNKLLDWIDMTALLNVVPNSCPVF